MVNDLINGISYHYLKQLYLIINLLQLLNICSQLKHFFIIIRTMDLMYMFRYYELLLIYVNNLLLLQL